MACPSSFTSNPHNQQTIALISVCRNTDSFKFFCTIYFLSKHVLASIYTAAAYAKSVITLCEGEFKSVAVVVEAGSEREKKLMTFFEVATYIYIKKSNCTNTKNLTRITKIDCMNFCAV